MFPGLWNVPVSNTSAAWSYREFTQHLQADKDTNYPMLPHCADPPLISEAVPIVIDPGDIMAFSGAQLHCSIPNRSGVEDQCGNTHGVGTRSVLLALSQKC